MITQNISTIHFLILVYIIRFPSRKLEITFNTYVITYNNFIYTINSKTKK